MLRHRHARHIPEPQLRAPRSYKSIQQNTAPAQSGGMCELAPPSLEQSGCTLVSSAARVLQDAFTAEHPRPRGRYACQCDGSLRCFMIITSRRGFCFGRLWSRKESSTSRISNGVRRSLHACGSALPACKYSDSQQYHDLQAAIVCAAASRPRPCSVSKGRDGFMSGATHLRQHLEFSGNPAIRVELAFYAPYRSDISVEAHRRRGIHRSGWGARGALKHKTAANFPVKCC
jgi:hypothetical protein